MNESKLKSLSVLKDKMAMNLEIYFSLNGQRYMLLPDPETDILDDGWLLVANDHLLKKGNTSEILNYKIDGKALKDCWKKVTDIEM